MLDKLKEADGIFCSNEPSTLGMLLALKQNNLAGSKKLVGFDTSPGLVEGLKRGEIQALVAQNPKKMGREAVQALVAKMKGETVHAVIDSGAAVVTKENLGTPEIQALLVQSKDIQWSWVSDHGCIEGTRLLFESDLKEFIDLCHTGKLFAIQTWIRRNRTREP